MGDSIKLWSEGPQICNIDTKVLPHFSFQAKCNYCGESIPFTSEVEREMRKHYNVKHRLYCNACKKGDFDTREELNIHVSTVHKDGICSNCHASFKLASALAMHVEGPRNECAVPHAFLINALRHVYQKAHNGVLNPNTVYSPVSCCAGNEPTIQKLKEFRKTLLLAHEKAFSDMQETRNVLPPAPLLLADQGATELERGNASCEDTKSPVLSSTATGGEGGADSSDMKQVISQIQDDIQQRTSTEWTCSTCVDAKFTTLSKLLQHVEQKVRNSWWMTLHP